MRPARALIDLEALRHNYLLARELSASRALAVIKADAYGHGAVQCARALADVADGFAVACIEEALELREAGVTAPILLLEGFFEAAELALIEVHDLWCVLHSDWQVAAVEQAELRRPLQFWLKLDSGMHRVGLPPAQYRDAFARLSASGKAAQITCMTHFARADEPDCARTAEQLAAFQAATAGLDAPVSLCNSPAVLGWPQVLAALPDNNWVRPGIMLYGATPFAQPLETAARLRPVMTLESQVIAVRELPAGEPLGYGGTFVTTRATRIGVVAMGYADGYPRHAPSGAPVAVDGQLTALLGRVSMDMLMVDLTDLPQAGLGSRVELWGGQVNISELASLCGTIAYQLLCNLKRVPRLYHSD